MQRTKILSLVQMLDNIAQGVTSEKEMKQEMIYLFNLQQKLWNEKFLDRKSACYDKEVEKLIHSSWDWELSIH